ncbi:MAG TPA: hypothetical protein VHM64_14940 [Candidatus Binatia bacterium]|nr:hypothetical protein [Candidatus Binatia bacterium]
MDVTNYAKEKLLNALMDYKPGPDGANGLYRLVLDGSMTPKERDELIHEAINIQNELSAFVQLMRKRE